MNSATARETIFALSSGQPPAAIAIVRISGPDAASALTMLAGRVPSPRVATLMTLGDVDAVLDRALVLYFPGPHSATGEDLVELHLHGGRAVVAAVERTLAVHDGLRRAEPGEFTRRAFSNGRLDLAEAEGLGDLLTAETEGQRRNAIALADGTLSRAVRRWREQLIAAAAAVEARIDFADEDDVPDDDGATLDLVRPILAEIDAMLHVPPAERLRDGVRVVIAGPPNAGKSTLFNALVGREAAIATPIPGTTRDLIEFPVQLGGIAFLFIDTAGLRNTDDVVERIGVDKATAAAASADLLLWLGDPARAPPGALRVHPRCDEPARIGVPDQCDIAVSAVTGEGMAALVAELVSRGTKLLPREGEIGLAERQRFALVDCAESLRLAARTPDILIVAESLRGARAALDRLTGDGGVEPLLDAIFGRFCIGK